MIDQRILHYINSLGGRFVACQPVSLPVYIVHVAYQSIDTDPFYPLDRALMRYARECPPMGSLPYFAHLTGFTVPMLQRRRQKLLDRAMLRIDGDCYRATADGDFKYLMAGSRPTVRVTGSFMIDGRSLDLMPAPFYESAPRIGYNDTSASLHRPMDRALRSEPFERLVEKLKRPATRKLLGLEEQGSDFEILDVDQRVLHGAWLTAYIDEAGHLQRILLYQGQKVDLPEVINPRLFTVRPRMIKTQEGTNWVLTASCRAPKESESSLSGIAPQLAEEAWNFLLCNRYGLPLRMKEEIIRWPDGEYVPKARLQRSWLGAVRTPERIARDCAEGHIDLNIEGGGALRIGIEHYMHDVADFLNEVKQQKSQEDADAFVSRIACQYPHWREWMVMFKFYDQLEALDADRYVKKI